MKPGRNDPCICGSGKKYKHCCAERDVRSSSAFRMLGSRGSDMDARKAGASLPFGTPWEAGVIPLPDGIESDPGARLAAALVVGGGFILHGEIVSHPPSEIDGIAAIIAGAVRDVIAGGALAPPTISIRHADVATALAPLLVSLNIIVRVERDLPLLKDVETGLIQSMGDYDEPTPSISMPHAWAGWQLPSEALAALFEAAAAFYEAKPWTHIADDQPLSLEVPGSGSWTAGILGNAGEEFGLALYEDPEDFLSLLTANGPSDAFTSMTGRVLSLTFNSLSDLPRVMQREVVRSGWAVAGPQAYPLLWALNTPGGGVTPKLIAELTNCLYSVARFAGVHEEILAQPGESLAFDWHDADSGIVVQYDGSPEAERIFRWPPVKSLTSALPEGPNANARGFLDYSEGRDDVSAQEEGVVDRFQEWLRASGSHQTRLSNDIDNARLFVKAMVEYQSIPIVAVTEYDLRVFVYDWFPRKVAMRKSAAMKMRGSLRRFFEFLDDHEGVTCTWAKGILRDKSGFEDRWESFPGGFFWDEDVQAWQAEFYDDLRQRVMLPSSELAGAGTWGETMGIEEARLYAELQREWLVWRDELIRNGVTSADDVARELAVHKAEWERQSRPDLGGRSVSQAIKKERSRRLKKTRQ